MQIFYFRKKIIVDLLTTLKSNEIKDPVKSQLFFLAWSYLHKHKPSIRVFHQHGILRNPRKIRDTIKVERDKGNGDVLLD